MPPSVPDPNPFGRGQGAEGEHVLMVVPALFEDEDEAGVRESADPFDDPGRGGERDTVGAVAGGVGLVGEAVLPVTTNQLVRPGDAVSTPAVVDELGRSDALRGEYAHPVRAEQGPEPGEEPGPPRGVEVGQERPAPDEVERPGERDPDRVGVGVDRRRPELAGTKVDAAAIEVAGGDRGAGVGGLEDAEDA